jgi:hypothetical protein
MNSLLFPVYVVWKVLWLWKKTVIRFWWKCHFQHPWIRKSSFWNAVYSMCACVRARTCGGGGCACFTYIDHRLCLVNMNILAPKIVALRHKIVVISETYNFDYVVQVMETICLNENEIPPKYWYLHTRLHGVITWKTTTTFSLPGESQISHFRCISFFVCIIVIRCPYQ